MKWSKAQLEALWATANPGNGNPHLMAAIALAESAGNDQSVNSIGACGLWQIHPYEAGCQSPTTNARQAGAKLRTQGLPAWETYTNGSYRQFLGGPTTKNVVGGIPFAPKIPGFPSPIPLPSIPSNPVEGAKTLFEAFSQTPGFLDKLKKVVELLTSKEGWLRIGKVLIGLTLIFIGIMGMANIQTGKVVAKGTRTAAKGAEVAALIPK